mgnify:CR=1 FL=1
MPPFGANTVMIWPVVRPGDCVCVRCLRSFLIAAASSCESSGRASDALLDREGRTEVELEDGAWDSSFLPGLRKIDFAGFAAIVDEATRAKLDTMAETTLARLFAERPDSRELFELTHASAVLERDLRDLEHGLETLVGPRGVRLSGGQIQRSAAARMFVRNADLLIFDDGQALASARISEYGGAILTVARSIVRDPELAADVMLTAVGKLGVDAAIIFADLLPILVPMGMDLEFTRDGARAFVSNRYLDQVLVLDVDCTGDGFAAQGAVVSCAQPFDHRTGTGWEFRCGGHGIRPDGRVEVGWIGRRHVVAQRLRLNHRRLEGCKRFGELGLVVLPGGIRRLDVRVDLRGIACITVDELEEGGDVGRKCGCGGGSNGCGRCFGGYDRGRRPDRYLRRRECVHEEIGESDQSGNHDREDPASVFGVFLAHDGQDRRSASEAAVTRKTGRATFSERVRWLPWI